MQSENPADHMESQSVQSVQSVRVRRVERALYLIRHHAKLQGVPLPIAIGYFNDFDLDQIESGELSPHAVAHVIRHRSGETTNQGTQTND